MLLRPERNKPRCCCSRSAEAEAVDAGVCAPMLIMLSPVSPIPTLLLPRFAMPRLLLPRSAMPSEAAHENETKTRCT